MTKSLLLFPNLNSRLVSRSWTVYRKTVTARPYSTATSSESAPLLCSGEWLKAQLLSKNSEEVVPIDATWFLSNEAGRYALKSYEKSRVQNARFFDLDKISDQSSSLPHMLPSVEEFSKNIGTELGISNDNHVVIYDKSNLYTSHRVLWMFKVFGHEKVSVLDGGFQACESQQVPLESGPPRSFPSKNYQASWNPSLIVTYDDMVRNIDLPHDQRFQVLDARSRQRFAGRAKEPREGLPSGHIPHSINVPFTELINPSTNGLYDKGHLRVYLHSLGVHFSHAPIVVSCGSGVTAAILWTALKVCGAEDVRLYDGSWTEYASKPGSRIMHHVSASEVKHMFG